MKRRLLAFTLAFTMTLGTMFTVNAEDVSDVVQDEVSAELSDETPADEQEQPDADEQEQPDEADAEEQPDADEQPNADEQEQLDADEQQPDNSVISDETTSETETESFDEIASEESTEESSDSSISLAANNDFSSWTQITNWQAGKTGGSNTFKKNSDGSVSTDFKKTDGKFADKEDTFGYYAPADGVDLTKNFVFKAKMNIDMLCNPAAKSDGQTSAGLLVMGPIQKTPPNIAIGAFMKDDLHAFIGSNVRNVKYDGKYVVANSDGTVATEPRSLPYKEGNDFAVLSDTFSTGNNKGTFDLSIEKKGYVYIVKCGDKEAKYDYSKRSFMGADGENKLIYPALYSARNSSVTFTDVQLYVDDREPDHIEIKKDADDRTAFYGNKPTLSGIELEVVYKDGSKDTYTDYFSISGYDENVVGKQMATISIGDISTQYEIEILKKDCTKIEIVSDPMKKAYFEGQYIRTDNMVVEAEYEDGSHVTLNRDEYEFIIKGKVIGEQDFITSDLAGDNIDFVVRRKDTPQMGSGSATDSFKGSVSPLKLTSMVVSKPVKTTYYIGDELNLNGMSIKAYYKSDDGSISKSDFLQSSEYTTTEKIDTSKVGEQTIVVTNKFDPSLTCDFKVNVIEQKFKKAYITSYPRTTYPVLSDDQGQDMRYWYDYYNGNPENITAGEDDKGQFNQGNLQITYLYSNGDEIVQPATEYNINLDNFDIRANRDKSKENYIKIEFPETSLAYGTEPIILPITVKDEDFSKNYWKGIIFGASTSTSESQTPGSPEEKDPTKNKMGIIFKDKNGKETHFNTKGSAKVEEIKDEQGNKIKVGTYTPVETYSGLDLEEKGSSVRIWATQGAGKQADSNDGMAYYYTRLSTKDNFKLSADILVNQYLDGNTDEARDGQEAFGIMARDVVSLIPDKDHAVIEKDKDGKDFVRFVYKPEEAVKDKYGEPEPYSISTYNYSNMVLLGGYSGSGWPNDPTANTYLFNTTKNRINLIYRTFITGDPYSASSDVLRSDIKETLSNSETSPQPEERYHLTLERLQGGDWGPEQNQYVNRGYKGTCYNYQNGEFKTTYICYDKETGEEDLDVLDPNNLYVGFFASRYADIEVSNVSLVKSDPKTDMQPELIDSQKLTVPKLYIKSSTYSTTREYNLVLRTSNNSGGKLTILQDGNVVYQDAAVSKRETMYPVILPENGTSKFEVMFTPSYMSEDSKNYQELSSYDPVYYTYEISHKGNFDTKKDFIYVAPNAPAGGTGDIKDPMDLDVAIGLMKRGQTVILLPGVYTRKSNIEISDTSSGTNEKKKSVIGYNVYQAEEEGYAVPGVDIPDEPAIIDLNNQYSGIINAADNWVFKNFHIRNGGKNCKAFHTGGDNNLVENIKIYDCQDSGMCVSRVSSDQLTIDDWPTNNLIKNCEVWNCADASRNNSDGYAVKLTVGYGNKLVGCVSHHNSDDGWDLFCKQSGGYMAPVTLEKCITYKGGYRLDDEAYATEEGYGPDKEPLWDATRGGRNGFKMGGDNMDVNNVLIDCIAFENGANGVTSNSNPLMTIRGCVGYMNDGSNFSLYSSSAVQPCNYDIKGVVSYKPGKGSEKGNDSIQGYNYDKDYNYLKKSGDKDSVNASGVPVTDDFFVSLESPVVKGHIPQDPKTGEFLLNGFLELTPEAKSAIENSEGYEDITTTEVDSTTTEDTDFVISGGNGGGGSKKANSSSTGSAASKNESNKTNDDKTDDNKTNDNKTDSDNKDNNKTDTNKTDGNKTESNNPYANENKVSVDADNGAKVSVPESIKNKVTVGGSDSFGGNAVSVEFDSSVDPKETGGWVQIPFNGDTSNPDNIVAVITDKDGNQEIIKAGYYDTALGMVLAPAIGSGVYGAVLSDVSFADMEGNWAKPYVEALAARGIVNGINDNTFAPNAKIKRGDFVLMLAQVVDIDSANSSGFSDVQDSDYYSGAIAAAKEKGIVKGISDTTFGAKENISRQDVMTIIARTLEAAGVVLKVADITQFNDSDMVSDYAKDAVSKLVGENIVSGNNGSINPKDSLTRAEASKMLYEVWKKF